MKAHILVFNDAQVGNDQVKRVVDRIDAVVNWYAFFGNVMCLASDQSAPTLSGHIRAALPDLNFMVTTVDPDQKGGWMPPLVWSFLDHPEMADADAR